MKTRELELEWGGVYYAMDYTLAGDGQLHIENPVRDNGHGDCEPCPLTPALYNRARCELQDEIEALQQQFAWELRKACRAGPRHVRALVE